MRARRRAAPAGSRRARRARARPFFGAACDDHGSSRAPATPARTAGRSSLPAAEAAAEFWASAARRRRHALRSRRARHAAARGRHEPVRQRHGRDDDAARIRARLDGGAGAGNRDFIGRAALVAQRDAGVAAQARRACCSRTAACCARTRRSSCRAAGEGEVTSGTFSPTLERSIGLARVPAADRRALRSRDPRQALSARVVKPPFVRNGKIAIRSELESPERRHEHSSRTICAILKSHEWARLETDGTVDGRHHRPRATGARRPRVRRGAGGGTPCRRGRGLRGRRIGQGRVRRLQPRRAARSSPAMRSSRPSPS